MQTKNLREATVLDEVDRQIVTELQRDGRMTNAELAERVAALREKGISILMPHIGEFATSMEMTGLSVSLLRVDDELRPYLTAPAMTPCMVALRLNSGVVLSAQGLSSATKRAASGCTELLRML